MVNDWKRQLDALHAGLVRRDDPAAWVTEADAVDASLRYPHIALRGPVFGVAVRDPAAGPEWRLLKRVSDGMPQQARDSLNSYLWFKAKDDTEDPGARRELLAAVSVLEREPVDELEVLGVRYRVARGEEFARSGDDGLEPPRPTDVEPVGASWSVRRDVPSPDEGFVLDAGREDGLIAGAMKLALRDFAYTGPRFPAKVRAESVRATRTHPHVVLLPVGFGVAERNEHGWRPRGALMPTPHDARRMLYDAMTETWPLVHEFSEDEKAAYAKAAKRFRAAGRADEARVGDTLYRICRIERMVRLGPDGPEPPRPSDHDEYGPMKMHPTMDADGTIHYS
ncbi:hypothetical protein GCM10009654_35980 [Streptomyces hebeiensis]|uniref:Aromatic ring-opening dioxygenase LigA n=1 Tax=Streptomyces hebeiensis TaxID=229486 RepID=A0ABN1UYR3_9ACTN